ncbi:MAG: AAA family ATPase [Lachnospiraceae bacterium]|nr:AAA family ATPase [Lachnospiraceae bacterium]
MAKTVSMGTQDFEYLRENDCFYVGMLDYFFSNKYEGRGDLFEGLSIWEEETYRHLQGTFPVIFITFAGVKANNYADAVIGIKKHIVELFSDRSFPLTI